MIVSKCEVCGGPMNGLDRGLCDRCCEAMLSGTASKEEDLVDELAGQLEGVIPEWPETVEFGGKRWTRVGKIILHPDEPVYSIAVALADGVLCQTLGMTGLMETLPQLEPDIYQIREGGQLVADAERHDDGDWRVEFYSGVRLSPGCIIV